MQLTVRVVLPGPGCPGGICSGIQCCERAKPRLSAFQMANVRATMKAGVNKSRVLQKRKRNNNDKGNTEAENTIVAWAGQGRGLVGLVENRIGRGANRVRADDVIRHIK